MCDPVPCALPVRRLDNHAGPRLGQPAGFVVAAPPHTPPVSELGSKPRRQCWRAWAVLGGDTGARQATRRAIAPSNLGAGRCASDTCDTCGTCENHGSGKGTSTAAAALPALRALYAKCAWPTPAGVNKGPEIHASGRNVLLQRSLPSTTARIRI